MSLKNKTIAFIGAGNMAEALVRGLLHAKDVTPGQIRASDVQDERRSLFTKTFKVQTSADNVAVAAEAQVIILCVKPQQMSEALASLRAHAAGKLFISIAAGIPTARIEHELGGKVRVVRVMPNTPALVGAGAAALCKGASATDDDLAIAEAILGAVGITVRTEEKFLDAVTALSGSGPAYILLVTEAMIQAGVKAGLSEELAKKLTIQTVFGAAKLLVDTGEAPDSLRRKVTSPGGTTEVALKVLSDRKLVEIFVEAVQAAAKRSKELSGS